MQTQRVLSLLALTCLSAVASVRGETFSKTCSSNSDCSDGAWCVAGDADSSVQRCVAGTPCGGINLGSCPSDPATGQLACIWRPDKKACTQLPSACKAINGEFGIYKCISLDRCDKYFGNELCSGGCNVNGQQCNGRGNCQVAYEGDVPSFQCACDSGWNGTKCDNAVSDKCVTDAGQCGSHGTCVKSACTCSDGYTGVQCEISPTKPINGSQGSNSTTGGNSTVGGSNSSVPTTSKPNNSGSAASSTDTIGSGKKGSNSTVFIIVGLLAALIVVAALLFALYSRKKKREQEATGAGGAAFGRAGSVDEGVQPGGPDTPKQNIVIM